MYIITQQGQTLGHKIGPYTIHDDRIEVVIEGESLEPIQGPGAETLTNWSNTIRLPKISLGEDHKQAIAEHLTSEGQPFHGGTIVDDEEFAFKARQMDMLMKVKNLRDTHELGGVATPFGSVIQTDADSQRKIAGATLDALVAKVEGEDADWEETWRMADDTFATVNADQMIAVGRLVKTHVADCQRRKDALDAEINGAATVEDLDLIDIESGWPSSAPAP